jgi:hypothetical protein
MDIPYTTLYRWHKHSSKNPAPFRPLLKRIQLIERVLLRTEKALAEAAALLILRKKAEAIWGLGEEQ